MELDDSADNAFPSGICSLCGVGVEGIGGTSTSTCDEAQYCNLGYCGANLCDVDDHYSCNGSTLYCDKNEVTCTAKTCTKNE